MGLDNYINYALKSLLKNPRLAFTYQNYTDLKIDNTINTIDGWYIFTYKKVDLCSY